MSWRVVVITQRCKLEHKLGYMVCRGEVTLQIHLNEIDTLLIESTQVAITTALLCELTKNKVNVIFCDEKHNPHSQLLAFCGRHDASGCLRKQLQWSSEAKDSVWTAIVKCKIERQHRLLQLHGCAQAELLAGYLNDIVCADLSNREGHSAKVYFNALFGKTFRRGDSNFVNSLLDYGYSILLSAFNREIVACGYNLQLGLAHKNEFNPFNLACDLMEPFRILVDSKVLELMQSESDINYKHELCNILNNNVIIQDKKYTVLAAIGIYCKSVFCALETSDIDKIICYEL